MIAMNKRINLDNLKDLKIKKEEWKEPIEKFVKGAIKQEAEVYSDGVTIEIIDKINKLNLFYIIYDQNVVVYSDKGKPLGAYDITINYERMLQLIKEN